MERFGIGQPLSRLEDPRLLTGHGRYLRDRQASGQAWMVLVRSPHAHARIGAIELADALSAPGVLGIYTGEDLRGDGLGTTSVRLKRRRPDGTPMFWRSHPGLALGRVRHVGDPVVAVVAETRAQAEDAAARVEIDYEPLASVVHAERAQGGAPVWDECPDNVSNVHEVGRREATEAAFARAAHVVKRRYVVTRVHAQYMEPRAALGVYDAGEARYTLYADVQHPHRVRELLATEVLHVPEHHLRVVAEDVGGGFGAKGWQYSEHRLVLWLARKLGRPVMWACERSEALLADEHGRDSVAEAELALDAERRFLGLRVRIVSNLGAYVSSDRNVQHTFANLGSLVGVYDFPAAHVEVTGVLTHTNPTGPYRGAGRPEAIYVLERLIDDAARELGVDRVALRRGNLIPASAMPYKTALTFTYDCGEFERNLDAALALADWNGFEARRAAARERGRLRGIGLSNAIERAGGPSAEYAEIRFEPDGAATVLVGTKSQGQGHETLFRQIAHARLGVELAELRFVEGDTDRVAWGGGTFGSRSTVIGGAALWLAADKIIEKGRLIAANRLEAAAADIEFADGRYTVAGTDRSIGLKEVAKLAYARGALPDEIEPGLHEHAMFAPRAETFPNSCHVCEVEIDPQTGAVEIVRYAVVDDVGTVVNPLTLKGQIHGGVVQGLGQVLMEQVAYDGESGQLLGASFMDYAMPRAADVCDMAVETQAVPTAVNPLGAKGAGEAGTVGALAAVMNAVLDALAPRGVRALDMPASAERVWRALRDAGAAGGASR